MQKKTIVRQQRYGDNATLTHHHHHHHLPHAESCWMVDDCQVSVLGWPGVYLFGQVQRPIYALEHTQTNNEIHTNETVSKQNHFSVCMVAIRREKKENSLRNSIEIFKVQHSVTHDIRQSIVVRILDSPAFKAVKHYFFFSALIFVRHCYRQASNYMDVPTSFIMPIDLLSNQCLTEPFMFSSIFVYAKNPATANRHRAIVVICSHRYYNYHSVEMPD